MRYFGDQPFAEYEGQDNKVPQVTANLKMIHEPEQRKLQVTWIGHATTLIQYQGINILTDPVLSDRASPFSFAGPRRYTQPALHSGDLPTIHYVVISHNHYDSLDQATIEILGNEVTWLVPLKLKTWFINEGINNVIELDWWQSKTFEKTRFVATPTQHFSGRGLWDYAQTLWSSWVIQIDDKKIWFGGDTGYNDIQFKRIGHEHGPFDLGLIPIGAYEPRWFMKPMHVNPEEAVLLHKDINARFSIGIHWGTFRLSAEAIDAP
ncbi:MAG: MBL fold metallo-hydrolase, partial [Arenicellales bacterium]|nr:MBL fold metallo-hydrolase [Arenicellales bacterium]